MRRNRVQSNRYAKHGRAGNEQPVQAKACGQELAANRSKHDAASVIDIVDGGVIELERADNVSGPSCDGSDKKQDDDARRHAQCVEG